jgi:acetylglutamate kinase
LGEFGSICDDKILIHGGGKLATQICGQLGLAQQFVDGRRITDAATMQVAAMTYAGWINKHIVALLQARGINAIGLSGADADCLPAVRRAPMPVDYGYVGDVDAHGINTAFLQTLLKQGMVPVLCAITHDRKGNLLNTNADSIAAAVAIAMSKIMPVRLIFCFEKNGVLRSINDDSSVIPVLNEELYAQLKTDGSISAGMLPKIDSAFAALEAGVSEVVVKYALHINVGGGTMVVRDTAEAD